MPASLSLDQARRIALAAQGLHRGRPTGPVTARTVGRTFARLQLVQIDSVNVLVRSHFLPFYSRLGNYDRDILQRMSGSQPRRMLEYWAHEASFIRPEHYRDLLLWQKRAWVGASRMDPGLRNDVAARILAVLASSRPMTASELTARIGHVEDRQAENWGWNWNAVKRVLEHLFEEGLVSAASRTAQFERRYTLTSKVLPHLAAAASDGDAVAALRRLTDAAAQAHGIGSVRCFADYFRTPVKATALAVQHLVEHGRLEPVTVAGWERKVFRHVDSVLPRQATGRALLSPFDSLVFERRRLFELFGFHYRIEIYTPEPKRRYGYYVLPFLLRDRMVARVDLKADRAAGRLLVRSAFAEPDAPPDTAVELAAELALMAQWLGLPDVEVEPAGDLAAAVAHGLARL
ncbi:MULTISPECIES: winged helix-turn-helix domain-containing protein [unclassified Pseudarthrobacter]|uniref:winged helix-turn-helix domain-containing protein n=1 Tax=unclassified Pseudarthrobacter TaxID=2647000 RepID=UPI001131B503|nr:MULTISPECIES: crosslink repair DNA glycosylase YcaQ family protein [unclassified Pseudarthrobacter]QDG62991.1 winged helix-turn-helix domain-containing protein [Pseudarthrobacter sp. NIBRBAC000502771]QDG88914.1 winged helix-turn-helix domain-containing protein [Pseudarthrobacter sp. NIBRBAC000502770]